VANQQAHDPAVHRWDYRQSLSEFKIKDQNRAAHRHLRVDGQEKEVMHTETDDVCIG
jgi:hypothetical protein